MRSAHCHSSVTLVWVFSWFSDKAVTLPVCHVIVFSLVCCEHMAVMLFPCAMRSLVNSLNPAHLVISLLFNFPHLPASLPYYVCSSI